MTQGYNFGGEKAEKLLGRLKAVKRDNAVRADREDEILAWLATKIRGGWQPTDRAIAQFFKLSSTDESLLILNRLKSAGKIDWDRGAHRREITICDATYIPPILPAPIEDAEDGKAKPKRKGAAQHGVRRRGGNTVPPDEIVAEIKAFLTRTGMAATAFGLAAMNDKGWLSRAPDKQLRLRTVDKAREFMRDYDKKQAAAVAFAHTPDVEPPATPIVEPVGKPRIHAAVMRAWRLYAAEVEFGEFVTGLIDDGLALFLIGKEERTIG